MSEAWQAAAIAFERERSRRGFWRQDADDPVGEDTDPIAPDIATITCVGKAFSINARVLSAALVAQKESYEKDLGQVINKYIEARTEWNRIKGELGDKRDGLRMQIQGLLWIIEALDSGLLTAIPKKETT